MTSMKIGSIFGIALLIVCSSWTFSAPKKAAPKYKPELAPDLLAAAQKGPQRPRADVAAADNEVRDELPDGWPRTTVKRISSRL